MDELPGFVVDDHVVSGLVGEENNVAFAIGHDAVAVTDRRVVAEYAPAGNDTIAKLALAQEVESAPARQYGFRLLYHFSVWSVADFPEILSSFVALEEPSSCQESAAAGRMHAWPGDVS